MILKFIFIYSLIISHTHNAFYIHLLLLFLIPLPLPMNTFFRASFYPAFIPWAFAHI